MLVHTKKEVRRDCTTRDIIARIVSAVCIAVSLMLRWQSMVRHLERAHENKIDVAKALSFPKGSKERKKQLDYIRKRGNYALNAAVMESGKGVLVPYKRPPKEAQGSDSMHCAYCRGLFTRKILWRLMRSCRLKPGSVAPKPEENRVQSVCIYTGPVLSGLVSGPKRNTI